MKRYFYASYHAAKWMEEQFDMRLAEVGTPRGSSNGMGSYFGFRFYIHPDSLHLLEPKVGDLVIGTDYSGKVTSLDRLGIGIAVPERLNGKFHYVIGTDRVRVLQRDGKPFHWPEVEEVDNAE